MKKTFTIGKLNSKNIKESLKTSLIIAQRQGEKIHFSNMEALPEGAVELEWNGKQLIMKFKLADGEFLALGDTQGVAKKGTIG
jgi:hypothetical protein